MKGLNLSKFKKMKEDKDWASLIHKDGHILNIAKAPLSSLQKKQLEALEMHNYAEGGEVEPDNGSLQIDVNNPSVDNLPVSNQTIPDQEAEQAPGELSNNSQVAPPANQGFQVPSQALIPGFEEEKRANTAQAKAIGKEGQSEFNAYQDAANDIRNLPSQNDIIAANKKSSDDLLAAYQSKKIDPDHYWNDHSKVAAVIGLVLGGLGAGLNGGSNQALDFINKGIEKDIEAQRNEQGKAMNLWQMNRQALGSDLAANLATQNQLYTGLKFQIAQAASESKSPIALANAQAANARIDQTLQLNNFKLSLLNPSSDNPDPASRVQFLVPEPARAKVIDEINAAKNTVANAPGILEAFDKAANEVRPLTGGVNTSISAFNPFDKTPGQQALQARLAPTFQDIAGTVRQAEMDNMDRNATPKFGDSDEKVATKRQSVINYLRSKSAASSANAYGIDLHRFPSTNTSRIGQQVQYKEQPQIKVVNGVKYMRGLNGQAVPVK